MVGAGGIVSAGGEGPETVDKTQQDDPAGQVGLLCLHVIKARRLRIITGRIQNTKYRKADLPAAIAEEIFIGRGVPKRYLFAWQRALVTCHLQVIVARKSEGAGKFIGEIDGVVLLPEPGILGGVH